MGRFSFRAGSDAEQPDFTVVQADRADSIRRLTVKPDGTVSETFQRVGGDEPEEAA